MGLEGTGGNVEQGSHGNGALRQKQPTLPDGPAVAPWWIVGNVMLWDKWGLFGVGRRRK